MFEQLDNNEATAMLILELKNTVIRKRHLVSIREQTQIHFSVEDVMNGTISLNALNSLLLVHHEEIVHQEIDIAIRQYSVERVLKNIARTWKLFWFSFVEDKQSGHVFATIDSQLYETLEDNQILLQNILLGTNPLLTP